MRGVQVCRQCVYKHTPWLRLPHHLLRLTITSDQKVHWRPGRWSAYCDATIVNVAIKFPPFVLDLGGGPFDILREGVYDF